MSSKFGMAAQALGVTILLSVVYFAFLAPDDRDSLSEIDADGGEIFEAVPPVRVRGESGHGPAQRSRERPTSVAVTVTVGAGVAPSPPASAVETPPGSQYDDAVARILGRVAQARR